jgi:hypothetical protein
MSLQKIPRNMPRRPRFGGPRSGLSVIYVGIIFLALIGFAGLAVDVGRMRLAREMLQTSADSGACAGAANLPVGTQNAIDKAVEFGQKNPFVDNASLCQIDPSQDVIIGLWDPVARKFHTLPYTDSLGYVHVLREANACSVTAKALNSRGNSVSLYFAPIYGMFTSEVPGMLATAYVTGGQRKFGIVGLDYIKVKGNFSDFDSALPPDYARRYNGSIASNGNIDLGNGDVYGDVRPGVNGDITQGPTSQITGWMAPLDQPLSFPPATVPSDAQPLSVQKNQPVTLDGTGSPSNPKNYVISGNWATNATVTVNGYVAVYVTGSIDLTGSAIVGNTDQPMKLRIYDTGTKSVSVGGSSKQYMELYAPQSPITVNGTPGFYGSMIGKSIDLIGTSEIHYDESMPNPYIPLKTTLVE